MNSLTLWVRLLDTFRRLCGYQFPRLGPTMFSAVLRTLPSTIDTQLFRGIRANLDLHDETQRTTYWYGTRFEQPTPRILSSWAARATHFFDIGSNYGFYSFFLYSLFPQLEIYPFEPNPPTFLRLQQICTANSTIRIHPQPYGLSDENQRLKFLQLSGNTGHSSFATVEHCSDNSLLPTGATLTECDVITFDEVTMHLGLDYRVQPGWVAKIDVEGYEMKVLRGMTQALEHRAFSGICIELVADNLSLAGTSSEEVHMLLSSYGYQRVGAKDVAEQRSRNHNAFYIPKDTAP